MTAAWPTSVATDANVYVAVNNLHTTLNGAIDDSTTTVVLTSAAGFPTVGFVTIDAEAIAYTGISTNTLTGVTRGADGTTAAAHSDGDAVRHHVMAAHHNALADEVKAIETSLNLTASRAVVTSASGRVAVATTTSTEIGYVNGVTSAIQTQLNGKVPSDGWVDANETWTYESASSFSVAADVTGKYMVGDKLTCVQTTTKYFYVVAVGAYSGGKTIITVAGGSAYTVANDAISVNYYSKVENPQGFPHWFATTAPTWYTTSIDDGSGGQPATTRSRFRISGRNVEVFLHGSGTKAGATASFAFNPSVYPTAAVTDYHFYVGNGFINTIADFWVAGTVAAISSSAWYFTSSVTIADNTVMPHISVRLSYQI